MQVTVLALYELCDCADELIVALNKIVARMSSAHLQELGYETTFESPCRMILFAQRFNNEDFRQHCQYLSFVMSLRSRCACENVRANEQLERRAEAARSAEGARPT